MKIMIIGDSPARIELETLLHLGGYRTSNTEGNYIFELNRLSHPTCPNCKQEIGLIDYIEVDSVDSELEQRALVLIEELGVGKFIVKRAGGNRSNRKLVISLTNENSSAVALGIYRAIDIMLNKVKKKKFWGLVGALLLCASNVFAQNTNPVIRFWNPTFDAIVGGGDVTNNALRVNCVVGCSAAATFQDNHPFTFSVSGITNVGFVVDDASTHVLSDGQAGAARITSQRILYSDLSKTASNVNLLNVTGTLGTTIFPVSGSQNVLLKQTASNTNLQVELATGATLYDARQIRALTNSDIVKSQLQSDSGVGISATGNSINVNCTGGCGGASTFADSSAFSFGTTAISNTGFVVDDTSTNTVAENSSGAARMNTNRILYTDLSKSVANTNAFLVTGTGGTFPVTGTFWQATQPVSGTFWQTTQPVSGTVTVTDGAGALNVIVDSGTTTVTQGTGTNLHAVIDSGSTTAVTQATAANLNATVVQPTAANLNATVAQATGTNLHTVVDSGTITTVSAARIVGNAGGVLDAANNATAPANVAVIGAQLQSSATATVGTAGQVGSVVAGLDHVLYVRHGGPVLFNGGFTGIGATLTQVVAAAPANTSHYITSLMIISNTATGGTFLIRSGTGANCGTGTATLWPNTGTTAIFPYPASTGQGQNISFFGAIKAPAAAAICIICVATNTCVGGMSGYTAP